jgi:hypothetical protein
MIFLNKINSDMSQKIMDVAQNSHFLRVEFIGSSANGIGIRIRIRKTRVSDYKIETAFQICKEIIINNLQFCFSKYNPISLPCPYGSNRCRQS